MSVPALTERNIAERRLIGPGARVLVAVSGGVDSMTLLHILLQLAPKHQWHLEVAHFNHALRGDAANTDERFVLEAGRQLGVAVHMGRGETRAIAEREGISIEMAGRQLRHEFLAQTARAAHCNVIAVAHHQDDQVETFWLRLLRGEAGLSGMKWKGPSPFDRTLTLVRPFLNVPKAMLVEFAERSGINHREDASNQDSAFERNELRARILPFLEATKPELRRNTLRIAEVLAEEKRCITDLAWQWLEKRSPEFPELAIAIQRELMRLQLLQFSLIPTLDLIETLRRQTDTPVEVRAGMFVQRNLRGEILLREADALTFEASEKQLSLAASGTICFSRLQVSWEEVSIEAFQKGRKPTGQREYFDAEKLGSRLVLRHWRPGDRFHPIGNLQASKLQDLFVNLKVPRLDRRQRVIAATESGEIFWVEGLRIAEGFKVRAESRRILKWSWRFASPGST